MRIAIFHDYLNQLGGAERVLEALFEIFPDADLYTLFYDKDKTFRIFENKVKKTSFLDCRLVRHHHRFFIPLMPLAAETINIDKNYELIISSSAGYAKGFNYPNNSYVYHICYCHSPLRYAWEIEYLKEIPFVPYLIKKFLGQPFAKLLRKWDEKASQKVNLFIANSYFIAQKIKSYYKRQAFVVYPPVDLKKFYYESNLKNSKERDYFLMVGRLLHYKRFDLGVLAFNRLRLPLKIVGRGPEIKKLKKLATSKQIEFISSATDEDLRKIYNNAKALIFPQIEDFGLVAAEAQACGLPVIAFNGGGAKEIVENRKTGLFFEQQTVEAIIEAVKNFERLNFDREYIASQAKRFSKEEFKRKIVDVINKSGFKV